MLRIIRNIIHGRPAPAHVGADMGARGRAMSRRRKVALGLAALSLMAGFAGQAWARAPLKIVAATGMIATGSGVTPGLSPVRFRCWQNRAVAC